MNTAKTVSLSSTGESIEFVRDDQGRITQIIDPSGAELDYAYNASGDLISFTDQVDNTTTFEYSEERAHFLDRVTGPRGNVINEVQYLSLIHISEPTRPY